MRVVSNSHLEQENARTYSRLRAADVPHAVPLIEVPKVSGVIPSASRLYQPMFYAEHPLNSQRTAYIAVAAAEITIELMTTAHFCSTRMNAKVERPVHSVHIARDFRRPSRV